jgi:hypothetical protein
VITPSRLRQLSGRDRNAQFESIRGKIQEHLSNHQPAISVDTKKKELVGNSQFDIASTCTETGLRVRCELDTRTYPKGLKVSNKEMAQIKITRHDFHGEWNYTMSPKST